jgi:hypothetical protein
MIVRIRFGKSRPVAHRAARNAPAARLTASFLSLVAISFAIFGFWRVGQDLGFAGDFVFSSGLLSHWQVWAAAAAITWYAAWWLTRYAKQPVATDENEIETDETDVENVTVRV